MKIDNMSDNVPTSKHLEIIMKAILRVQLLYNITAEDVMSGKFTKETKAPLSLNDAFDFARAANGADQPYLAVDWLKYVTSRYDSETTSFSLANALNLLASSYIKVLRYFKLY